MQFVDEGSLALTLDAVNEAVFLGRRIPRPARTEVSTWIAGRQGVPGSYADMFAPTEQDFVEARVFTGEAIASRAATGHILGEEAIRALDLLGVRTRQVRAALETERNFRKIMGYKGLWMLKAVLDEDRLLSDKSQNPVDNGRVAAQDTRESPPNLTLRAGHTPESPTPYRQYLGRA